MSETNALAAMMAPPRGLTRANVLADLLTQPDPIAALPAAPAREVATAAPPPRLNVRDYGNSIIRQMAGDERAGTAANILSGLTMNAATFDVPRGAVQGIRAFHGSPHRFDRFDLSRIGTGEGAQAYGHGLYFAESEDVAKMYRDNLSRHGWSRDGRGVGADPWPDVARAAQAAAPDGNWRRGNEIADAYLRALQEGSDTTTLRASLPPQEVATFDAVAEAARGLSFNPNPGSMYEVNLRVDPNRLLDWDAPLSQQPEVARRLGIDPNANARRAAEIRRSVAEDMRLDGRSAPDQIDLDRLRIADDLMISEATGGGSSFAPRSFEDTKRLRDAGIQGVRYLDGGSRGAGDGTRNYVIFDDALIDIVRRYGLAALLGGGAAAAATGTAQAGQQQ